MPLRATLLGLLAVALVALAGCGDGDPVRIEGRTLDVRLEEYRIVPENVSVAPGRLRVVAVNVGRLTHNLKVVQLDEDDREAPAKEIGGTRTAQPGETATYTFEDLAPGEYRMACTISNHEVLGQYGKLIVEKEGP